MKFLKIKFTQLFLFFLVCFSNKFGAQINITNGSISVCSGTFLDNGGTGNYSGGAFAPIVYTICNPTAGQPIYMNFTQFDLWANGCIFGTTQDNLRIYNGASTASPLIGNYTDQNSPGMIIGGTGCLTFEFDRNDVGFLSLCGSNSGDIGWSALISCTPFPPPPPSGDICTQALPFCTSDSYTFPNNTNIPAQAGANYGCLATQPNPVWYYMQVDNASTFQIQMSQTTGPAGTGSGIDVDFALYGPFTSLATGCASVMSGGLSPIQCSYSTASTETVGIGLPGGTGSGASTPPATIVNQFYIILLTNYANQNGFISFSQTGGTGIADCSIINPPACDISTSPALTACSGGTFNIVSNSLSGTGFSWSGPGGYSSNVLSPTGVIAPIVPGTYEYIVTTTTPSLATCKDTVVVTVPVIPNINFNFDSTVCISQTSVFLEASPVGGTFSGTGITAGPGGQYFNTASGNQTLTYTIANGCNFSETINVVINPNPVVNGGDTLFICTGAPVTLISAFNPPITSASPTGGSYSGTGIAANAFDPSFGSNTVSYIYTDMNGCTSQDSLEIAVMPLPSFILPTQTACINDPDVTLTATPIGTTFSGTGVTTNQFDPSVGTQTITYSFTNSKGCFNDTTKSFVVNPLPTGVSAGTYPAVCIGTSTIPLSGTPAGGTFTINGVAGTSFNPTTAGTANIVYTFTNGNGCSASASTTILVNPLPTGVSAGTYGPVCAGSAVININGGSPTGGTYTINAVAGTSFNPTTAGTAAIVYTYTNANGCSANASTSIIVNPLPTGVSAGTYPAVCIGSGVVTLSGTPSGGIFSGLGVVGTNFTPSTTSTSPVTITYVYTNSNNCSATVTSIININPLPTGVSAGAYTAVCQGANAVNLVGTPAGGTFTINGVAGTSFNPSTVGTAAIIYTYTNANGCTRTANASILVNALPTVSAGNYGPVCANGSAIPLAGSPSGGTFSGTGVAGGFFTPANATVSPTNTITYAYTSPTTGCSNTTTTNVVIIALPVVDAGPIQAICQGAIVQLSGSGAGNGTYTWNNSVINNINFNPNFTTLYTVTGVDANGCIDTDTVTVVVYTNPNTVAVSDTTFGEPELEVLFDNFSTNALDYEWNFGFGETIIDEDNVEHLITYETPGNYTVVLTANNLNCTTTDTIEILILPYPDAIIVLPNIFTPNDDKANDEFFIPVKFGASINVLILNRWGQVMIEQKEFTARWDGKWKGEDAADGVYFYKYVITDKNGKEYKGQSTLNLAR